MLRKLRPILFAYNFNQTFIPSRKTRANMLFQILTAILGSWILTVQCRDTSKPFRSIPTITGSLVNLGKMDISFHFNSKDSPLKMESPAAPHHSFLFSKSDPIIEEPCPCSSLRGIKDSFANHPTDILNKILTNGDLFSFNKEPTSSTLCCGSHEHAQEDIVTFEFGPKEGMSLNPHPNLPKLPFIFENILKRPGLMPIPPIPGKQKTVEIFVFPKKKDISPMFMPIKKDFFKKENIQVVGDKEYRNDFKSLKFRPSLPLNFQSSVKKDLTAQQKNETEKQIDKDEIEVTTAVSTNPNSLK